MAFFKSPSSDDEQNKKMDNHFLKGNTNTVLERTAHTTQNFTYVC